MSILLLDSYSNVIINPCEGGTLRNSASAYILARVLVATMENFGKNVKHLNVQSVFCGVYCEAPCFSIGELYRKF